MKNKLIGALFIPLFALISFNACAQGALSASQETMLNASASDVWAHIGDFGGLHTWHPAVTGTELTGSGTDVGDIRVLTLGDGAKITEELRGHSNEGMSYSYAILESPLPVANYESTIKVESTGDNSCKVMWSSTFDAKDVMDIEAIGTIDGIYTAGLDALVAEFQ
ncbi:MAG: SRPBCC family protein [Gammaproteobacteria bacterium]|nr:SRPBCC family protein [Gammaproteobacteria bacterium]